MKNHITLLLILLTSSLIHSQTERFFGAESALQKSEIIRAVPQESNGYLIMQKDSRVEYWIVNAIKEDQVLKTYQTERGVNHIQMEKEVYNDWTYSFKIMGISETGDAVLDIDFMPIDGDPIWYYNGCNRPTCVKTSGGAAYAYGMEILENVNNDSYKLQLLKAWSHEDNGIRIPYYIEVNSNNLSAALNDQGHTFAQGESPQTYFWDNGMYKVALGMGIWQTDVGISTNPINGAGGEGCTLNFGTAMNRMNASATLSSPLECYGQQYSQNQSGGGDGPFSVGDYSNASVNILDCDALVSNITTNYNYHWEEVTNADGIVSYVLVFTVDSTSYSLDCDETSTSPNSPCPPGYYYAPGGGDPCKPIEPILENLHRVSFSPVDVPLEGQGETLEQGLYLTVLTYADNISIPIYKKIESSITLAEDRAITTDEVSLYPNPMNNEFTILLNEDKTIISYSIIDRMGIEVKKGTPTSRSNQEIIDASELEEGIYFVNIESDANYYSKSIIKQ